MADVNTYTYQIDGSTRSFTIPTYVESLDYLRVDIDGTEITDPSVFRLIHNALVFEDNSLMTEGSILRIITTDSIGVYADDDIFMKFDALGTGTQLTITLGATPAGAELSTNTDSLQAAVVTGTPITLVFNGVRWNAV